MVGLLQNLSGARYHFFSGHSVYSSSDVVLTCVQISGPKLVGIRRYAWATTVKILIYKAPPYAKYSKKFQVVTFWLTPSPGRPTFFFPIRRFNYSRLVLMLVNIHRGGFKGGPSRLRPPPFGRRTDGHSRPTISQCFINLTPRRKLLTILTP